MDFTHTYAHYAHLRTLYAVLRRLVFGLQQDSRRRSARLFQPGLVRLRCWRV